MSRLAIVVAILDDIFLFILPAVLALVLHAVGVVPLWIALVVSAPFLALAAYVGVKVVKETPRGYTYLGGRGVVVEDLKPMGVVKISGEYWRAVCDGCEATAGSCVELVEIRGGVAYVKPCRQGIRR
ncbi:NfeD family protein [Pyrobaculum aerophilum]|uniref:NfeD family protein n=1 Tax=Pyrobaculum aerophilum TaxID=13773 RepID=UPI002FDACAE1